MKVALYPVNRAVEVPVGGNLLTALLSADVPIRSVCRGRGICATCQVTARGPAGCLTPKTPQEAKTLSLMVGVNALTRLACQCRVLADGLTLELPTGLFVESLDELLNLIGDEAVADYRHPVTGAVLIPKEKIITRTLLTLFKTLTDDISKLQDDA